MSDGLTNLTLISGEKGQALPRDNTDEEADLDLVYRVGKVTTELAKVLEEAGIRLPQFRAHLSPYTSPDWLVHLGDCNVRLANDLLRLCRDGLTLRRKYPDEVGRGRS